MTRRILEDTPEALEKLHAACLARRGPAPIPISSLTGLPDPTAQRTVRLFNVEPHPTDKTRACVVLVPRSRVHIEAVLSTVSAKPAGSRTPDEQTIAAIAAEKDRTSEWDAPPPDPGNKGR